MDPIMVEGKVFSVQVQVMSIVEFTVMDVRAGVVWIAEEQSVQGAPPQVVLDDLAISNEKIPALPVCAEVPGRQAAIELAMAKNCISGGVGRFSTHADAKARGLNAHVVEDNSLGSQEGNGLIASKADRDVFHP